MRFTKNPNYWQPGRPYLDEIVVNVRKDAVSSFRTGLDGSTSPEQIYYKNPQQH